jgi:hypothetical protein
MRKVALGIMGVAALAMVASTASAQILTGPPKAKGIKGELVNAYTHCDGSPGHVPGSNGVTNPPISLPACTAELGDTDCFLDAAKGKGKWQASVVQKGLKGIPTLDVLARDVAIKASIGGLNGACIGETLTVASSNSVTTDDCAAGDCTVIELSGFPVGQCVVSNAGGLGKCGVKGTVEGFVDTQSPGNNDVFKVGKRYSIAILGTKVLHGANTALEGGVILQP